MTTWKTGYCHASSMPSGCSSVVEHLAKIQEVLGSILPLSLQKKLLLRKLTNRKVLTLLTEWSRIQRTFVKNLEIDQIPFTDGKVDDLFWFLWVSRPFLVLGLYCSHLNGRITQSVLAHRSRKCLVKTWLVRALWILTKWSQSISAYVQPANVSAFWIFFWTNCNISVIPTWIAKLNKALTHVHFLFESPEFTLYQSCPLTHKNHPNLRYKIRITNHRHISKMSTLIWHRKHTTPTQYF